MNVAFFGRQPAINCEEYPPFCTSRAEAMLKCAKLNLDATVVNDGASRFNGKLPDKGSNLGPSG